MVGWHHVLNGHEFGWALGVGDGQGGLACCGPQGCKDSDTTEWLNWTELSNKQVNNGIRNKTSLMVQMVKNPLANAGNTGLIPGSGRIHMCRAAKSMCHNYWAKALEPDCCTYWAQCHNYWNSCALEPMLCNRKSYQNEKSTHSN